MIRKMSFLSHKFPCIPLKFFKLLKEREELQIMQVKQWQFFLKFFVKRQVHLRLWQEQQKLETIVKYNTNLLNCWNVRQFSKFIQRFLCKVIWQLLMQSYISHLRGTIFHHLIIFLIKILPYVTKSIGNYRKYDIFFNFCFTENIFPSIVENPENMIFTLDVFTKMLLFMQHRAI